MQDIHVIDDAAAAAAALDPVRGRLLAALSKPASAAMLAERVGLTRQKVNYHLRALEAHGLARVAEQRRWGGLTEHLFEATARSFVVSPDALGPVAADPKRAADRLSASYLVALAARVVKEVGAMWRRAAKEERRLATFSLDTDIRFASPAARAAFAEELAAAVTSLAARYHDEAAPKGRAHRVLVMAYPKP